MNTVTQWQLLLLAAATAVNVLLAYRLYRLGPWSEEGRLTSPVGGDGPSGADPPLGERIECPACGVENESGYRFCRDCLSELPGAARFDREPTDPLGGLTR